MNVNELQISYAIEQSEIAYIYGIIIQAKRITDTRCRNCETISVNLRK